MSKPFMTPQNTGVGGKGASQMKNNPANSTKGDVQKSPNTGQSANSPTSGQHSPNMNDNKGYGDDQSNNKTGHHTPNMNDNRNYGNGSKGSGQNSGAGQSSGGQSQGRGDQAKGSGGQSQGTNGSGDSNDQAQQPADARTNKEGSDNSGPSPSKSLAGLNNGHNRPKGLKGRLGNYANKKIHQASPLAGKVMDLRALAKSHSLGAKIKQRIPRSVRSILKYTGKGIKAASPILFSVAEKLFIADLIFKGAMKVAHAFSSSFLGQVFNFIRGIPTMLSRLLPAAGKMLGSGLHALAHGIGHMVTGTLNGIGHITGLSALGHAFSWSAGVTHVAESSLVAFAIVPASNFVRQMFVRDGGDLACEVEKIADNSGLGALSGTAGNWTKKGTKNYNGAKQLWQALKSHGANDTQAAGVVGALAHEAGGAFGVPDIAQGYYTWTQHPTEKNAGISSPGVKDKAAAATSGGMSKVGASMFQYTPFTKYAPASDSKKWQSWPDLLNFWFKKQVPGQGESISNLKKCSSISDAVQWTLDVEEGKGSKNAFSDRLSKAKQAYKTFQGVGGSAADETDAAASGAAGAACKSAKQEESNNSGIVNFAKKFVGKIPYTNAAGDRAAAPGKMKDGKANGASTDCSGFVYAVLKDQGYKVPSSPWSTANMLKSNGGTLKNISASDAGAGDVVIMGAGKGGDTCHTAILEEKWRGMKTKVINEGADGSKGSNVWEGPFHDVFLDCLGKYSIKFGQPVKK